VDTALTPRSWYPVAFQRVQISAPHAWQVERYGEQPCGGNFQGYVLVNQPMQTKNSPCFHPLDVVALETGSPPASGGQRGTNGGLSVVWWTSGPPKAEVHHVSALGVTVSARGPLADKVLHTVTYSPLAVVLAARRIVVPSDWRSLRIGPMEMSVPAWCFTEWRYFSPCDFGMSMASAITFYLRSNGAQSSCPAPMPTVGGSTAVLGVTVASWTATAGSQTQINGPGCRRAGSLSVCANTASTGGVTLSVQVHDLSSHGSSRAHRSTRVTIGLAGDGTIAKTIFESIRPVASGRRAGAPTCLVSQLSVRAGRYGTAAGSFSQTFTFTNHSTSPCTLRGWPSLEVDMRAPYPAPAYSYRAPEYGEVAVLQTASERHAFGRVLLRPSGTASFDVYGADWNAAVNHACPRTHGIGVLPPGDPHALTIDTRLRACSSAWRVSPVVPGSSDRKWWSEVMSG
jgi:hypothetical protein